MLKSEEIRQTLRHTENKIEVIEHLEKQIEMYMEWLETGDDLQEWQIEQNNHYHDCITILDKAINFISDKL